MPSTVSTNKTERTRGTPFWPGRQDCTPLGVSVTLDRSLSLEMALPMRDSPTKVEIIHLDQTAGLQKRKGIRWMRDLFTEIRNHFVARFGQPPPLVPAAIEHLMPKAVEA